MKDDSCKDAVTYSESPELFQFPGEVPKRQCCESPQVLEWQDDDDDDLSNLCYCSGTVLEICDDGTTNVRFSDCKRLLEQSVSFVCCFCMLCYCTNSHHVAGGLLRL